ncbi:MAG: preprotein translocase subunit SecA, partial [Rhodococcus sp. (in: high G+C Gram-positive bacteria)]|nr:preprotein translocase subunit SecA [Rhodococcus sp. (in: high G+C Gram-positive bacteria)]
RLFKAGMVERVLSMANVPEDVPIESKMVTRAIASAQTQVEQQNFEIRKNVLKYDEVMNQQRKVIYEERRRILEGENLQQQAHDMLVDVVTAYVDGATADGYVEDWDLEQLWTALRTLYPVGLDHKELATSADGEPADLSREELREALLKDAHAAYARREAEIDAIAGEGGMRELERRVLLSVLDRKWREHLYEMDYLKEGIGLRAMAQRDPLVEYQREGYDMFVGMLEGLKEESVGFLFNLQVEAAQPQRGPGVGVTAASAAATAQAAPTLTKPAPAPAAPAPAPAPAPATLRAKGLDEDDDRSLTYTGPAEDGSAQVRRSPATSSPAASAPGTTGTRRQRREAARKQAKAQRRR